MDHLGIDLEAVKRRLSTRLGAEGLTPAEQAEVLFLALGVRLSARVGPAALTPAEQAEVLCMALGVGCELSAAARGVSPDTIRARRRRLRAKLERAIRAEAALAPTLPLPDPR